MRFQNLISNVTEAFKLKDISKYRLGQKGQAYHDEKINKVFNNKDRVVLDFDMNLVEELGKMAGKNELLHVYNSIDLELSNSAALHTLFKGAEIEVTLESYLEGYAIVGKQRVRIGKLLEKVADKELLRKYKMDTLRNMYNKKYKIVISRHPYDIAGASTDRDWVSCMTMGTYCPVYRRFTDRDHAGQNRIYIYNDIQYGTLVAYLVADTDRHPNGKLAVRKPFSRIFIKPFDGNNINDVKYGVGLCYGVKIEKFSEVVREWVDKKLNNAKYKDKEYFLRLGLYNDSDSLSGAKTVSTKNKTLEKWVKDKFREVNEGLRNTGYKKYEVNQRGYDTEVIFRFKIPEKYEETLLADQRSESPFQKTLRECFYIKQIYSYVSNPYYSTRDKILKVEINMTILNDGDYIPDSGDYELEDGYMVGNNVESLSDRYQLEERLRDMDIDDMVEDYFNWKEINKTLMEKLDELSKGIDKTAEQQKVKELLINWFKIFVLESKKYRAAKEKLNQKIAEQVLSENPTTIESTDVDVRAYVETAETLGLHLSVLKEFMQTNVNTQKLDFISENIVDIFSITDKTKTKEIIIDNYISPIHTFSADRYFKRGSNYHYRVMCKNNNIVSPGADNKIFDREATIKSAIDSIQYYLQVQKDSITFDKL